MTHRDSASIYPLRALWPRRLKVAKDAPFIVAMHDLFNPAGLFMLEDQQGAIAYGYLQPRVFYTRWVGHISVGLGARYVEEMERRLARAPAVACFADTSALLSYAWTWSTSLARCLTRNRARLSSLFVFCGSGCVPRSLGEALAEPTELMFDPLEFELSLSNVARFDPGLRWDWASPLGDPAQLWQVHAPI